MIHQKLDQFSSQSSHWFQQRGRLSVNNGIVFLTKLWYDFWRSCKDYTFMRPFLSILMHPSPFILTACKSLTSTVIRMFIFLPLKKDSLTGLEHDGEWLLNFLYWVNYPFKQFLSPSSTCTGLLYQKLRHFPMHLGQDEPNRCETFFLSRRVWIVNMNWSSL